MPMTLMITVDAEKMLLLHKSSRSTRLCRNTFSTPSCLAVKATWSMLVIAGENTSPLIWITKKCLQATDTARHERRTLPI